MSTDTTPATAEDVKALEVLGGRYDRAVAHLERLGSTVPLRAFALVDVPALLAVAVRGVQARVQLDALAGLAIRAAAVRELHGAFEWGAGLILCSGCSSNCRDVLWPCRTLQALDGLTAP